METALRVLTAINERHEPALADAEELRRLAPGLTEEPLDEMACDVIRQALTQRAHLQAQLREIRARKMAVRSLAK